MNLKSNMCCSYCTKILKKPISLPCGDSLCEEHLAEASIANQSKIKCCKCEEEFIIKDHKFLPNNTLQTLIDDFNFLSPNEQKFKYRIDHDLNVLLSYVEKFQTLDSELISNPKHDSKKLGQKIEKYETEVIQYIENKSKLKRFFLFFFFWFLPCVCFYCFIFISVVNWILSFFGQDLDLNFSKFSEPFFSLINLKYLKANFLYIKHFF